MTVKFENCNEPYIMAPTPKKQFPPQDTFIVDEKLLNLLQTLHKKKAKWQFRIAENFYYGKDNDTGGKHHIAKQADVYEGDTLLGCVYTSTEWTRRAGRVPHFNVESKRIFKQRGRVNTFSTASEGAAIRSCIKHMYPDSLMEVASKARTRARETLDEVAKSLHYQINGIGGTGTLSGEFIGFALAHEEDFLTKTAHADAFHNLVKLLQDLEIVKEVEQEKKCVAYVQGNRVFVFPMEAEEAKEVGDNALVLYQDEDNGTGLPDWLQSRLGLLKLCNDKQFVRGVGCRVGKNTFMIVMNNHGENNGNNQASVSAV